MTGTGPLLIDELLDGLTFHWRRLPEVAAEFASWGDLEQLDFLMEWPLQEQDLELLSEHVAAGLATAEQRRPFDDMLRLVERHRPLLGALADGRTAPGTAR